VKVRFVQFDFGSAIICLYIFITPPFCSWRPARPEGSAPGHQHVGEQLFQAEGLRQTLQGGDDVDAESAPDEVRHRLVAEGGLVVAARVRAQLGAETRFAAARDGMRGFWVSFFIDEDEFWVMLPRERFEPELGLGWLGWGAALLALALLGAWLLIRTLW